MSADVPTSTSAVQMRTAAFGAFTLALLILSRKVWIALAALSATDSSSSHLILIPFLSLGLMWRGRESIFRTVGYEWRRGVPVMAAGLTGFLLAPLVSASGGPYATLSLQVASLLVLWIGGFLVTYGLRPLRAGLFPLLFLALTIPIPSGVIALITRGLTTATAPVLSALFTFTGTDYHREGFLFVLPTVTIRIADECSGIRSTIVLLVMGLLAGHLYLTRVRNTMLLLAALLSISVFKNAIRIATLTLLAIHVDRGFLTGRLHQQGGILFFLLALALAEPVLSALRRSEKTERAALVEPTFAGQA